MSDALNAQLLTRLEELSGRYDAITAEMSDPATSGNSAKIVRLAKEHHNLGRMVEPYRKYRGLTQQLTEARAMLGDPDLRELAEAEIPDLEAQTDKIMDGLVDDLLAGDDANVESIILEIRAGTGGEEAALFAGDLYDIYSRYAAGHGFKIETLDLSHSDKGGYREVILNIKGPGVYTHLGYEGGGHRVQRVPITEGQGRIHTSAATVAVLPEVEETEVDIDWDKDVLEHVSAAGGPGGQNVNKVATAIKLEHIATGITVSMRDERSQHKNRAKARRLMASRVNQHYEDTERAKRDSTRKTMIGSGDRSERIRTYNYPQNRCTDHRVNENFSLDKISNGELDEMITALRRFDRQQRLANVAGNADVR
jgi:peptide chain release factor 1